MRLAAQAAAQRRCLLGKPQDLAPFVSGRLRQRAYIVWVIRYPCAPAVENGPYSRGNRERTRLRQCYINGAMTPNYHHAGRLI